MNWLMEYAQPITAFATVGLLIVWIVYAQMFYQDYTRRLRPRIIVDQMSGPGTSASCTLANLSAECVYIECVLATVFVDDVEHTAVIREQGAISSSEQPSLQIVSQMRQGPLGRGQLIVIGAIEDLVRDAAGQGGDEEAKSVRYLDIRVVATMSSEDNPVGAWKRFEISESGKRARALRLGTQQMHSRAKKREVLGWIDRR